MQAVRPAQSAGLTEIHGQMLLNINHDNASFKHKSDSVNPSWTSYEIVKLVFNFTDFVSAPRDNFLHTLIVPFQA